MFEHYQSANRGTSKNKEPLVVRILKNFVHYLETSEYKASLDNCVADGKSKEAHFTITLKDSEDQTVTNLPHAYTPCSKTVPFIVLCARSKTQSGKTGLIEKRWF